MREASEFLRGLLIRFRLSEKIEIDNLRGYPAERVEQLCALLSELARGCHKLGHQTEAGDIIVRPDPLRDGFYDVEAGGRAFYIHTNPVSGKILLLATWRQHAAPSKDS